LDGDSANVDIVVSDEEAVDLDAVPILLSKLVVSSSGDEFNEFIVGICCEIPMLSAAVGWYQSCGQGIAKI